MDGCMDVWKWFQHRIKFSIGSFIFHSPPINLAWRMELYAFSWDNILQEGHRFHGHFKPEMNQKDAILSIHTFNFFLPPSFPSATPAPVQHALNQVPWAIWSKSNLQKKKGCQCLPPHSILPNQLCIDPQWSSSTEWEIEVGNQKAEEDKQGEWFFKLPAWAGPRKGPGTTHTLGILFCPTRLLQFFFLS